MNDYLALLGMLLTVIVILILAYGFTKYLARFQLGKMRPSANGGKMRLVDQLAVGSDQRIALVQIGSRYLILGLSSNAITQLAELSEEEAALWNLETADGAASTFPGFRSSLLEAFKQKRK